MSHQRLFTGVQEEEEGWLLEAEMFSLSICNCISPNTAKGKWPNPDSATAGYKKKAKCVWLREGVN